MRRNELPDTCFSVLPSTGQLMEESEHEETEKEDNAES